MPVPVHQQLRGSCRGLLRVPCFVKQSSSKWFKQIDNVMAKRCDIFSTSTAPGVPRLEIPTHSFGQRWRLQAILDNEDGGLSFAGKVVTVGGWARTVRKQGGGDICFVSLNDGSTASCLQIVVEKTIPNFEELLKCGVGCSFKFTGVVVESPAEGQAIEVVVKDPEAHSVTVLGGADQAKYPLSKKKHGREFLREIAHLRPRTFLIGAVARIRSQLAMSTHRFFNDRGFHYIHTPIITAADCEGGGEMFQVTTILNSNAKQIPSTKGPDDTRLVNYKKDFFGKPAYLTVSGQLAVENYCCALGDVYTFGPTFRAENSHTSRHLSEFWMIEPEMAFADLNDNMNCAEAYLKYCVEWVLKNCHKDIEWFDQNIEKGLIVRLNNILEQPFTRVSYTEVIAILEEHQNVFQVKPEWGFDLGAEHERFITEAIYMKPVIVYNYPKSLKAFYMRGNEDGKTVAAMDVLLPKIGEVIGGSQREERLEQLDKMIEEKGLDKDAYWWYRELRQYGTIPHSGFGLGFERLIMMVTGIDNIRDVIPFPRYPGHAEF